MGDLFHRDVPDRFIEHAFSIMERTPRHTYQVLTKQSGRMMEFCNCPSGKHFPAENVWLGVSVERQGYTPRINHLRQTDACVRFLSLEPLLGPLPDLDLEGIDWVIVGGESGPGARPMKPDWARSLRDQCLEADGVPFFFKQHGGVRKGPGYDLLDGVEWKQFPGEETT